MLTDFGIPYYNISEPSAIFTIIGRGALLGYQVQVNGTAGVLTLNDCATLAEASAANQITSLSYSEANGPAPASYITWGGGWPLQSGLVVSAIPTNMVIAIAYKIWVQR